MIVVAQSILDAGEISICQLTNNLLVMAFGSLAEQAQEADSEQEGVRIWPVDGPQAGGCSER